MIKRNALVLLFFSFLVGLAGFFGGSQYSPFSADEAARLSIAFWISGLWLVLLVIGLLSIGRVGLWLLLSAPFGLFWPAATGYLFLLCSLQEDCL